MTTKVSVTPPDYNQAEVTEQDGTVTVIKGGEIGHFYIHPPHKTEIVVKEIEKENNSP